MSGVSWKESNLQAGDRVGGATLTKCIAAGAGVVVWTARTDDAKKRVVCTLASGASDDQRAHFLAVADGVSGSKPPIGTVPIVLVDDEAVGYVADLSANGTLADVGSFGWNDKQRVLAFRHLVRVVAGLHDAGKTHGWLQPENVVIDARSKPRVMNAGAMDVGGACGEGGDGARALAPWAAPEVRAGGSADKRSDVYSLGRILLFLLLKRTPPSSDEDVPRLDALKNEPEGLVRMARRCLLRDEEARYANANGLITDFELLDAGKSVGTPHPDETAPARPATNAAAKPSATTKPRTASSIPPPRIPEQGKRLPKSAVAGMLAVVLLAAVVVVLLPGGSESAVGALDGATVEERVAQLKALRDKGETAFRGAELAGADLSNLDLKQCAFDRAVLRGCKCAKTDFTDAYLWNVDVTDADFSGARLGDAMPHLMTGWETTTCDAETRLPSGWGCTEGRPALLVAK
jgi:hypothetical protein